MVHYEELFPNQLEAFYEGVSGYLYCVEHTADMKRMPETHEDIFYSLDEVPVKEVVFVPDVYKEILRYETEGKWKVLRFSDATEEMQAERVERIATTIAMENLPDVDTERARFVKHYFQQAWELAERRRK